MRFLKEKKGFGELRFEQDCTLKSNTHTTIESQHTYSECSYKSQENRKHCVRLGRLRILAKILHNLLKCFLLHRATPENE